MLKLEEPLLSCACLVYTCCKAGVAFAAISVEKGGSLEAQVPLLGVLQDWARVWTMKRCMIDRPLRSLETRGRSEVGERSDVLYSWVP